MAYTAVDFEKNHGDLVRQQYGECVTAYKLDKALRARRPPICMTQGLLKQWLLKYGRVLDAAGAEDLIRISSRAELESKYGDTLATMADEYSTPYRLCAALKKRSPPVLVTDAVAKEWFKYNRSALKYISKAGDLEVHCGARIREGGGRGMEAESLRTYLREELSIDVSAVTYKTWQSKDWSSDGALRSVYDIEAVSYTHLTLPTKRIV